MAGRSGWRRRQTRVGKYRSRFEKQIADQLKALDLTFAYEEDTILYVQPEKTRRYTPDFRLRRRKWYLEVKGKFDAADRAKHLLIKEQGGPEVRFLFYNAHAKLRKGSKTTYAMWCDKHGFKWSHRTIPKEWL